MSAHSGVIVAALVGAALLVGLGVRASSGRGRRKDPKRAFTQAERLAIFRRAGNRCEHKPWLLPRCSSAPTHADHVYPHSRGGATALANGAALCAMHNMRKSDRVPSPFYIWRLEKRRRGYFPAGEPVEVTWRQGVRR